MDYKNIVSNVNVYGLDESIKAAKYPMSVDIDSLNSDLTDGIKKLFTSGKGEGHDQALTGITVQFDLSCSVKMWTEAERYRFLYFVSSQSTMHRIAKFDYDKSYVEYVDRRVIDIMKEKLDEYNKIASKISEIKESGGEYDALEEERKRKYLELLYTNPNGFILTARMTTNYRQLKTIYAQRKNHRLPEWRAFCHWIETLPMSELITGENK